MITLRVNGEERSFGSEVSVARLLDELAVRAPAIAVEVNREIVPKSAYEDRTLGEGDVIEIVTFVGGG